MRSECYPQMTVRSSNANVRPEPYQVAGVQFFLSTLVPTSQSTSPLLKAAYSEIPQHCFIVQVILEGSEVS